MYSTSKYTYYYIYEYDVKNFIITRLRYLIPHRVENVHKFLTLNKWYISTYHRAFKGLKSSLLEDESEP